MFFHKLKNNNYYIVLSFLFFYCFFISLFLNYFKLMINFFGIAHRDIKPENILFSEENEITSLKIF